MRKRAQSQQGQSQQEKFWDLADQQTAKEKYPDTPEAVGREISKYQRENPNKYERHIKELEKERASQEKPTSWKEVDDDIKNGKASPQDISDNQWAGILEESRQELESVQDPKKNLDQKPYCNIYARDRLLQEGIYMEPGKNANQMIDDMNKEGSSWEKLPQKTDEHGNSTGKLDHQEAQHRAEEGDTVVAAYRNPNNDHGHISLINADAGMQHSGPDYWNTDVPSVDGYNTNKKEVHEGESLSQQFGKDKESDMDYYVYEGEKRQEAEN